MDPHHSPHGTDGTTRHAWTMQHRWITVPTPMTLAGPEPPSTCASSTDGAGTTPGALRYERNLCSGFGERALAPWPIDLARASR